MVELKKIRTQQGGLPSQWLVKLDGEEIGLLERYDRSSGNHPWKAYKGIGTHSQFMGAFYGSNGKRDAFEAVVGPVAIFRG